MTEILSIARIAERGGFEALWLSGLTGTDPGRPAAAMELLPLLGALAVSASRLSLGAVVEVPGTVHPAVLAKNLTTLDVLTGGRVGLALVPAEGSGSEPLVEALTVCRLMFTNEEASFEGTHYGIDGAINRPGPRSLGGPGIVTSWLDPPSFPSRWPDGLLVSEPGDLVRCRQILDHTPRELWEADLGVDHDSDRPVAPSLLWRGPVRPTTATSTVQEALAAGADGLVCRVDGIGGDRISALVTEIGRLASA